jgi:hypothetical protein
MDAGPVDRVVTVELDREARIRRSQHARDEPWMLEEEPADEVVLVPDPVREPGP